MQLKELTTKLEQSIQIKRVNENEYQIISRAEFSDQTPYSVFLMQDSKGNRILTDKKQTMKYMDEFFDLDSQDVKTSINAIIDNSGFKLYQNAIVCKVLESDDISERYFEFISCITQLANMYVFFDKPQDND